MKQFNIHKSYLQSTQTLRMANTAKMYKTHLSSAGQLSLQISSTPDSNTLLTSANGQLTASRLISTSTLFTSTNTLQQKNTILLCSWKFTPRLLPHKLSPQLIQKHRSKELLRSSNTPRQNKHKQRLPQQTGHHCPQVEVNGSCDELSGEDSLFTDDKANNRQKPLDHCYAWKEKKCFPPSRRENSDKTSNAFFSRSGISKRFLEA